MKTCLRIAIMGAAVAVLTVPPSNAQAPTDSVSFRVAKGDTYINLFGQDWEKAYRQNKVVVMRTGHPVSSPDILVENSIVTLTGDVELTQRAWSRVQALKQRRAALQVRLAALTPKLSDDQGAQQTATECRRLLESTSRFAADVGFAEQEIAHLERLARTKPATEVARWPMPVWWIIAVSVVGLALAVTIFWFRRRSVYPEGRARYREALADAQTAFRRAGVDV